MRNVLHNNNKTKINTSVCYQMQAVGERNQEHRKGLHKEEVIKKQHYNTFMVNHGCVFKSNICKYKAVAADNHRAI